MTDKQNKLLHIFVLAGVAASLVNFDGPLIKALLTAGYRVTVGAGDSDPNTSQVLKAWDIPLETPPLARAGMNPIADMQTQFTALVQHG